MADHQILGLHACRPGRPVVSVALFLVSVLFLGAGERTDEAPMMRGDSEATGHGWDVIPLFTVGETIGDYQPPGVLDGIGAFASGSGSVRLLVTHELRRSQGYRYRLDNGTELIGARVSFFELDTHGSGFSIANAGLAYGAVYDRTQTLVTEAAQINELGYPLWGFDRFCSATAVRAGDYGFVDDIFFAGEEASRPNHPHGGTEWALDVVNRTIWAAPAVGRGAWENAAAMDTGDPDSVALLLGDDLQGAPLYLYVGRKEAIGDGSFLDRNGLLAGTLHVWRAHSGELAAHQFLGEGAVLDGSFVPISVQEEEQAGQIGYDAEGYLDGNLLRARADVLGAFSFSRPEDVHTNPGDGSQAVFATTGPSLDPWGTVYVVDVDFQDLDDITASITIVHDADGLPVPDEGIRNPDNLTWAGDGQIYVQEDRSTNLFGAETGIEASIWQLDPLTGGTARIAEIDRSAIAPEGVTDTEPLRLGAWESSGILDLTPWFTTRRGEVLLVGTLEAHTLNDGPIGGSTHLIEGGQLFLLSNFGMTRGRPAHLGESILDRRQQRPEADRRDSRPRRR